MSILEMTDDQIKEKFSQGSLSMHRDSIDVTSNHRPDIGWNFVDSAGHEHRWFVGKNRPAIAYHPQAKYRVPSIKWVKTGTGCYEDGTKYSTGVYKCKKCGEEITPGYTADQFNVYIAGTVHYLLNDVEISKSEANRLLSVLYPNEHVVL